ncbi:MAG: FHA domain-containing protein [Thermomicrobiales bacterium]|nr:FHA domain-containing protein [Thermomicrobiales bacterium]
MNVFDRFESALERLVEGGAGKLFHASVQPAEIGRRLERTMAVNLLISVDATLAPNDFLVALNPTDHQRFADFLPALRRHLEEWLTERAAVHGWTLVDRVRVGIVPDVAVPRRDIRVKAAVADLPPESGQSFGALAGPQRGGPGATPRGIGLRVTSGPQQGQVVLIPRQPAAIGRAPENDVVVLGEDVSRRHARIEWDPDGARLVDLGSTNGVFVNGRRVAAAIIRPGDEVRFGSVAARVFAPSRNLR